MSITNLFYLIKEQIEYQKTGVDKQIFVPISYLDYSKKYFSKTQIADIEKYLWEFTKEWPLMYEVYDKKENMSFQIVGQTNVYDIVTSIYKISLDTDEEANKFYKLIKALFILQTEFPNKYSFEARIAENGGLEFIYNMNQLSKTLDYETLSKFIREEFLKNKYICEEQNEEIIVLEEKLEKLKKIEKEKTEEYRIRQKQVTTYLECKKTFFGRIRYFFKRKTEKVEVAEEILKDGEKEKINPEEVIYDDKEYYTIEDLINVTKILERTETQIKNANLDIKAIESSIERLDKRIENAKSYIDEIEEHKKSIFEFWKFVNKDNLLRTC